MLAVKLFRLLFFQLFAVFHPFGEGAAFLRVFGVQTAIAHCFSEAFRLMFPVQLFPLRRVTHQPFAVLDAFGKGFGGVLVVGIKAAGIHGLFHVLVHCLSLFRVGVARGPGVGKVGHGVSELFDLFRLQLAGKLADELADFRRLVLVFRDVHDFPGIGVHLVQVNDGLREVHFLPLDVRAGVTRAPEPVFHPHDSSFYEVWFGEVVRAGLGIDAD
ncbi:hypothetical protein [uncultured Desulfovibrio sp.]|uniref:hypothetical protein n=1 Tax=uncultured Desulfovibrio sp. TaxID=167968 RepID=UPI002638F27F|nr:hypothetical protein [uncultured Desulfovibrio sp.]